MEEAGDIQGCMCLIHISAVPVSRSNESQVQAWAFQSCLWAYFLALVVPSASRG